MKRGESGRQGSLVFTKRATAVVVGFVASTGVVSLAPVQVPTAMAAPPPAEFTADVQTNGRGSGVDHITPADGRVFFVADDGVHGAELWVRFGAGAATLVEDVLSGPLGSNPTGLVAVDDTVYFSADDGVNGFELWTSDGTADGTSLVRNINNGSGQDSLPGGFVEFDGDVFFAADDGVNGRELWRTDGTVDGTVLVANLRAGPSASSPDDLVVVDYPSIASVGERLWMTAETTGSSIGGDRELISVDGGGVVDPVNVEITDREPRDLVAIGESLYFAAEPAAAAGFAPTTLHRTTLTGGGPPANFTTSSLGGSSPTELTAVGTDLLMVAGDPSDRELYVLDAGSVELAGEINATAGASPTELAASGSTLYFAADDGTTGNELWRWTAADGVHPAANIAPAGASSNPTDLLGFGAGGLVFSAQNATIGLEPWVVLPAGEVFVLEELYPGATAFVDLGGYASTGDAVSFYATTPAHGRELFEAQTSPAPTVGGDNVDLVADIWVGTDASYPEDAGPAGPTRVMWSADHPTAGREPIVHDPVAGTTALLKDIRPGAGGSSPFGPTQLGSVTLFGADNGVIGDELWKTDGTGAGTTLVKDIRPGPNGSNVWDFTELDGFLYFQAGNGTAGIELWRTDGTSGGTTLVKDIAPGGESSAPEGFVEMGGALYFRADTADGAELFRTSGTAASTVLVDPADQPLAVTEIVATDDRVFFVADEPGVGAPVLWVSDGTAVGTKPVESATAPPPYAISPYALTAGEDGRVYFFGEDGDSGAMSVWVSDGTDAGTRPLIGDDAFLAADQIAPLHGGGVVFSGGTPATGHELWVSDGSSAGTELLEDIAPGGATSGIDHMALMNGWVYFIADDQANGFELWRTDGATVEPVTDIVPGAGDGIAVSTSVFVTAANDHLVFVGETLAVGAEVWFVEDVPNAPAAPTAPVASPGPGSATVSWTPPLAVAGAPVTRYTVTSVPGGRTCTTTGATACTVTGLTPGTSYRFTVRATNRIGTSPASAQSNAVVPTVPGDDPMVPLLPARLLETRVGPDEKTVDGEFEGIGVRRAGSTLELVVAGRGGVPEDADAVMLNVTAVFPDAPGYITVFPCGEDRPLASNVNYAAGQVVPNAVLAKIGAGGAVCLYTLAGTDLLVDVNGFVPDGGSPATIVPARLLETRVGPDDKTVDGEFEGIGVRRAGSTLELVVAGRGGVPEDADAVMLNVTAVFPDAPGYITVFPCGEDRPLASNVNYAAGQVVPNAVLAKIGAGGAVCLYTLAGTDLLVDVNGFVPDGGSPATIVPARLLETRVGPDDKTVDGEFEGIGVRRAGSTLELVVAGRGGVPEDADAVMLNVTAVFPDAPGYITVFPCGEDRPLASNVNYAAGQVVPNAVLAKIGAGGAVCLYTLAGTDLLVDVVGSI